MKSLLGVPIKVYCRYFQFCPPRHTFSLQSNFEVFTFAEAESMSFSAQLIAMNIIPSQLGRQRHFFEYFADLGNLRKTA